MRWTLNAPQRRVLRRLADNAAPLSKADSALALTIYALRSRGLVRTTSERAYWSATITDAGRALLAGGPDPRPARTTAAKATIAGRRPVITVEELVAQVQAAGGELRIPDPPPQHRRAWRQAIHEAIGSDLLPAGVRLTHRGRDHGDLIITFVATIAEPKPMPPASIPVPGQLRRAHPIVAATPIHRPRCQGQLGRHHADELGGARTCHQGESQPRAADHAGAHRRSRTSRLPHRRAPGVSLQWRTGHSHRTARLRTRLRRGNEPRAAHPTRAELHQKERYEWTHIPPWDYVPSGRIQLRGAHDSSQIVLANDRSRWRLEDRLEHALAKLEARAEADEARRREDEARRQRRHQAWQAAMHHAQTQFIEHHRAQHLTAHMTAWRLATDIHQFTNQVRATRGATLDRDERAWLDWADAHANQIDPQAGHLAPPESPDASPEELRPFLNGWNPYGPDSSYRR